MDKLDTEILNEIQWKFPLVVNPFDEMAKKFRISSNLACTIFNIKDSLIFLKGELMNKVINK